MPRLIITEKPNVAKRIAEYLGSPKVERQGQVTYYQVDDVYIAPAVGHIFGLKQKKHGWGYPVFDIDWAPSYQVSPASAFTKKYLDVIKDLAKKCDSFINACDYDIEGEVIGYNVVRHACNTDPYGKNVKRMKYSTLTKDSILNAYKNLSPIDRRMAEAGLTRHMLDWFWGINMSRALSQAVKSAGKFTTLSIGRVQGPSLRILAQREKKIGEFTPQDFWEVTLDCIKDKIGFTAIHVEEKFFDEKKALAVKEKCGNTAVVLKAEKSQYKQNPPAPFDLTTLQTEAYRHHGISPAETLNIAQTLYTNAYISYPRTSSQQIPEDIDVKKIIGMLGKQEDYHILCEKLFSKNQLKPANGRKKDPAHPAIHPTGEVPKKLGDRDWKIYDLVVRRFLACFGDPAIRQTVNVLLENNGEQFKAEGKTTVEANWHVYYGPYAKFEEVTLPELKENDVVDVRKINFEAKKTQPPKRYSPAGIVRELEKKDLGTKATRSQIIEILFKRGYVHGKSIEVTPLGMRVVDTLTKYCPQVLSEKMTRRFEKEMEEIQEGKLRREDVVAEAEKTIQDISVEFKKKEREIGSALVETLGSTMDKIHYLGDCPTCGKKLVVRHSRAGKQFIGCTGYPNCTHTQPLPQGKLERDGECKHCGGVQMKSIKKGKRPFIFCLNPNCPGRREWGKSPQDAVEKGLEEGKPLAGDFPKKSIVKKTAVKKKTTVRKKSAVKKT